MDVLETRWPGAALRASAAADRAAAAAIALENQLETLFGPVSGRSWTREHLRGIELELAAAGLHRALTLSTPDLADAFKASRLLEIAGAALDDEVQPRRYELPGGWAVEIDASWVRLHESDHSVGA